MRLAAVAEEESGRSAAEWATDLGPWSRIVECGRGIWGDQWAFYCLSNLSAGIRSNQERWKEADELLDHTRPLCPRARHARLRSANRSWWQAQFRNAKSEEDRVFSCLVALTWARPGVLISFVEVLDETLSQLGNERWLRLIRAVRRTVSWGYSRTDDRVAAFEVGSLPASITPRTVVALATRGAATTTRDLYLRFLASAGSSDEVVLEFMLQEALDSGRFGTKEWAPDLDRIRECYSAGARGVGFPFTARTDRRAMPIETASAIAERPDLFPTGLLAIAEEVCRRDVARRAKPVASVAEEEGWFGHQRSGKLFDV
jgi:hypothetical protein